MYTHQVVLLASVVFAGILCQWVAWWLKLPAILFLLLTGIIAGPVTGLLDSKMMLGDLLFPFISLSVAMILFEGSLTLKLKEISGLTKVVRRMITIGVPVTWVITSVVTRYALDISWSISLLFGSVVVVTGPTVIVPMLRTVKPKATIASILRWEGIVIDPVGATLALLVYEFILAGSSDNPFWITVLIFARIIAVGMFMGVLTGWFYGIILRNHWLPKFLHNVGTLSFVGAAFALSNLMQHESGLLTVTIMGMWLANMDDVPMDDIIDFKESVSVLLISVLFIVLASRVNLEQLYNLGWSAAFIFIAIQFFARPISVMASTAGSSLEWPERHMLAWIAPRGIVAAAISSIFAIGLMDAGYKEAELIVPLTFMVIIGTVLLQSATSKWIAGLLGVRETFERGVLIIGGNRVAVAIGLSLKENGFHPLVVDRDWEKIASARASGLDTYLGEAVSEFVHRNLDLVGIGNMLAMTPSGALNALSCLHYRMELGTSHVYMMKTRNEGSKAIRDNKETTPVRRWQSLFRGDLSFSDFDTMLTNGWSIQTVEVTERESWDTCGDNAVHLFTIEPDGRLRVFTDDFTPSPEIGWRVISLIKQGGVDCCSDNTLGDAVHNKIMK